MLPTKKLKSKATDFLKNAVGAFVLTCIIGELSLRRQIDELNKEVYTPKKENGLFKQIAISLLKTKNNIEYVNSNKKKLMVLLKPGTLLQVKKITYVRALPLQNKSAGKLLALRPNECLLFIEENDVACKLLYENKIVYYFSNRFSEDFEVKMLK